MVLVLVGSDNKTVTVNGDLHWVRDVMTSFLTRKGWILSTASMFFVLFNLIIVLLKVKDEGIQ